MNKNYYCFTKYEEDRDSFKYFNSLSNEKLNEIKIIINILGERNE